MPAWRDKTQGCHPTKKERAMFDEPPFLPMRAAVASLLGGLFGVGLILATHTTAQAQGEPPAVTLRSMRIDPAVDSGVMSARGLRLDDKSGSADGGPRWQVVQPKGWRSEGEGPRRRDPINVGVQVRF